MKTISKGDFGVYKVYMVNKRACKVWLARGTKTECISYIIELANNSCKLSWCTDVQLSLHVFPRNNYASFYIIKYENKSLREKLRIEYIIARYEEKLKVKVKNK